MSHTVMTKNGNNIDDSIFRQDDYLNFLAVRKALVVLWDCNGIHEIRARASTEMSITRMNEQEPIEIFLCMAI